MFVHSYQEAVQLLHKGTLKYQADSLLGKSAFAFDIAVELCTSLERLSLEIENILLFFHTSYYYQYRRQISAQVSLLGGSPGQGYVGLLLGHSYYASGLFPLDFIVACGVPKEYKEGDDIYLALPKNSNYLLGESSLVLA